MLYHGNHNEIINTRIKFNLKETTPQNSLKDVDRVAPLPRWPPAILKPATRLMDLRLNVQLSDLTYIRNTISNNTSATYGTFGPLVHSLKEKRAIFCFPKPLA